MTGNHNRDETFFRHAVLDLSHGEPAEGAVAPPGKGAKLATRSHTYNFITLTSDLFLLCALAARQRQRTSAAATGPDAEAYVKNSSRALCASA